MGKINLKTKAFTLVELIVVISIIGLIITLSSVYYSQVKRNNRDYKRLSDISEIQMALEEYKLFEGRYPATLESSLVGSSSGIVFLKNVPVSPEYDKDDCSSTSYNYHYDQERKTYTLSFCLEGKIEKYAAGIKCALPGNILNRDCQQLHLFTLNYSAGIGGSLVGSSTQALSGTGSSTPVTAVPDVGYVFFRWSDGLTDNPRNDLTADNNLNVTAEFMIRNFTLNYSAGIGGSLVGSSTQVLHSAGNSTPVQAVPNTGYVFVRWSDGLTDNPRNDLTADDNLNVTAEFSVNQYALNYSAGSGGSISGPSSQTVNHGSNGSQVTAVPNAGYSFVKWSDNSTSNPRTDTNVTANKSVTANFTINQYALNYSAGSGGSISGSSSQTVSHGSNGSQVTAVPNAGYSFVKWSDNSTSNPRTDTNVTANKSVTANFAINQYALNYSAGSGGSISGSSSQTVSHGSNGSQVTAIPNTNYSFISWSDGVTTASRTDTNVTANKSVTANFTINQYALNYSAGSGGSISGSSSQTVNHGSNGSQVTAVPNAGYSFVKWSDNSTSNPRTDTNVTANKSVTANFVLSVKNFAYTGAVQQYVIPVSGTYKMTVIGAKGGKHGSGSAGGAGGQAIGNKNFSQGDVIYVYVGGQGAVQSSKNQVGGWNGGGNSHSSLNGALTFRPGTGGGASDIRFGGTALSNRIIVGAGGGGAGGGVLVGRVGGNGGGINGEGPSSGGTGGTQSAGGNSGGTLGQGGASGTNVRGAGGGGYYGGGASGKDNYGGGGGSSYVGNLSNSSTSIGVNSSGDGSVIIEFVCFNCGN